LGTVTSRLDENHSFDLTPEQVHGISHEAGHFYMGFIWLTPASGTNGILYCQTSDETYTYSKTRDTSLSVPEITSTDLPNGIVENEYSYNIHAMGARPIEFGIISGELPNGITLSSDGMLSGVPTEVGSFVFVIRAINIHGFDEELFTLTINDLAINHLSPRNLPSAIAGDEYEVQFDAMGETGSLVVKYNLLNGNLPNGLSLTESGRITGVPTTDGVFFFIVRVENSSGYVDFTRSITVEESPNIITNSLPTGIVDKLYDEEITISGTIPIALSVESGVLPNGLSIRKSSSDTERYHIYGTPTESGSFEFVLKAVNEIGFSLKEFIIYVRAIPETSTGSLEYFQKINNSYQSSSRQETDLQIANKHLDARFADSISFHVVERNGEPLEALIERDTDRNNHIKKIKTRNKDKINVGDYIGWDGHVWLIMSIDPDNKLHNHGMMYLCNLKLSWQNVNGDIIERWGYTEDFTKYSRGINEGRYMTTGDYQYGVTFPVDDETKLLKRERRFAIDFEGVYPPDVYKITNRKIYQNDNRYFDRGGILTLALSFDFFSAERDELITLPSGEKVWICGLLPLNESPESESDDVIEIETDNPFNNWWK
jgi:hypothetical protein